MDVHTLYIPLYSVSQPTYSFQYLTCVPMNINIPIAKQNRNDNNRNINEMGYMFELRFITAIKAISPVTNTNKIHDSSEAPNAPNPYFVQFIFVNLKCTAIITIVAIAHIYIIISIILI